MPPSRPFAGARSSDLGPGRGHQVAYITLGICLATWLSVFGVLLLMAPYLPMTAALPRAQAVGVISLAATLMMARSPASMVRQTCPAQGPDPTNSPASLARPWSTG